MQVSGHSRGAAGGVRPEVVSGGVATVVGGAVLRVVQYLQVSGHSRGSVGGVRPEVLSGGVATVVGGVILKVVQCVCRHLGTAEELQAECDHKYRLEVWLRGWEEQGGPQRMEMLTMFLKELFPGLRQLQQFQHRTVFIVHCHTPDFSLADTFDTLESCEWSFSSASFCPSVSVCCCCYFLVVFVPVVSAFRSS